MPEGTIYVGRTAHFAIWANPFWVGGWFTLGDPEAPRGALRMSYLASLVGELPGFTLIRDRAQAVEWYRRYASSWNPELLDRCRRELFGHDLCCWCPLDQPCHADVLIELANS